MSSSVNEREGFTFVWKIENGTSLAWNGGELDSPMFVIDALNKSEWYLKFTTSKKNSSRHVNCFLARSSSCPSDDITVSFCISITDADGSLMMLKHRVWTSATNCMSGKDQFINKQMISNVNPFLLKDTWTIRCCIRSCSVEIPPIQCYARTIVEVNRKTFTFNVNPFSALRIEKIISIHVPSTSNAEQKLKMTLYTKLVTPDDFLLIDIQLIDVPSSQTDLFLNCKVSFIDSQDNFRNTQEDNYKYEPGAIWTLPLLITRSKLVEEESIYLPNGFLSLQCDIRIYGDIKYSQIEESVFHFRGIRQEDILNNEFENLYLEKKFCDVTLRADGRTFQAHKIILGTRSKVFAAMFEADMTEKNTNIVDITDIDAQTLDALLKFIYSQKLDDMQIGDAMKLYTSANKYDIPSLRNRCSKLIATQVSTANICDVLALAEMHDDDEFKEAIKELIHITKK